MSVAFISVFVVKAIGVLTAIARWLKWPGVSAIQPDQRPADRPTYASCDPPNKTALLPMQRFSANHLHWSILRKRRTFLVRVVEPQDYAPTSHAGIFTRVIEQWVSPRQSALTGYESKTFVEPEPFDLAVFPEAFAPIDALLEVFRSLERVDEFGCVHVGLRSVRDPDRHLLAKKEIQQLVDDIGGLGHVEAADLEPFKHWLSRQRDGDVFNLGCLFLIDANQRLRICIHPKVVRSQFESNPLPEHSMAEADLLTLVTLHPENKSFLTITLQPLLCSDALSLQTDRATGSPIVELQQQANIFDAPPDHVDVVTVATCTPQRVATPAGRDSYREWHDDFRTSFVRAAQDGQLGRHHFATFILSNFCTLEKNKPGGLSGVFEPINPGPGPMPSGLTLSCYGKAPSDANNKWSVPARENDMSNCRGYIASLEPSSSDSGTAVTIFGFTLLSLLRDNPPWKARRGISNCDITFARWTDERDLIFSAIKSTA
jgi:hypothetical protein